MENYQIFTCEDIRSNTQQILSTNLDGILFNFQASLYNLTCFFTFETSCILRFEQDRICLREAVKGFNGKLLFEEASPWLLKIIDP